MEPITNDHCISDDLSQVSVLNENCMMYPWQHIPDVDNCFDPFDGVFLELTLDIGIPC